jgi:hypothetical protein
MKLKNIEKKRNNFNFLKKESLPYIYIYIYIYIYRETKFIWCS